MAFIKYEYKILKDLPAAQLTEANLNAQGQEGWKLININQRASGNLDVIFIRE